MYGTRNIQNYGVTSLTNQAFYSLWWFVRK